MAALSSVDPQLFVMIMTKSGPRTREYWEAKLVRAHVEFKLIESELVDMRGRKASSKPSRRQKGFKRLRYLRRRILMLGETKIPYYEQRIEALTPGRWDLLTGPDLF